MISERNYHSVSSINNYIYAIGGWNTKSTERYEIFADKWHSIGEFDEFDVGVATVVKSHRFLYAFGGSNSKS